MSCMLRIFGKTLNVEDMLKSITLKPSTVFVKGQPRVKNDPQGKKHTESGVNIVVSKARLNNLDKQIRDASKFLKKHKRELKSLIKLNGPQGNVVLDFGIKRRDVMVQCDEFPSQLLELAGNLGISIQLSQYPN